MIIVKNRRVAAFCKRWLLLNNRGFAEWPLECKGKFVYLLPFAAMRAANAECG